MVTTANADAVLRDWSAALLLHRLDGELRMNVWQLLIRCHSLVDDTRKFLAVAHKGIKCSNAGSGMHKAHERLCSLFGFLGWGGGRSAFVSSGRDWFCAF